MKPTLVIHGGAIFDENDYTPDLDSEYRKALQEALTAGYSVLSSEGSALQAIETSIRILEDCGLFDAGRGAVYSADGTQAHDASIMDGTNRKAGAVAGVNKIKNPISAARKVMDETWHVLLIGNGAVDFAKQQGLEIVEPSYFHNERKYKQYLKLKLAEEKQKLHGTVGAVALDMQGNLAAGTSTGGLEMKHYGRVGDTPIIGAATYADNEVCAVSCTGEGEFFIRTSAAHNVWSRMKYKGESLDEATNNVLAEIKELGGLGGLIAIDSQGNISTPCTTGRMFRGNAVGGVMSVEIDLH